VAKGFSVVRGKVFTFGQVVEIVSGATFENKHCYGSKYNFFDTVLRTLTRIGQCTKPLCKVGKKVLDRFG
jgi:hypothetical protein